MKKIFNSCWSKSQTCKSNTTVASLKNFSYFIKLLPEESKHSQSFSEEYSQCHDSSEITQQVLSETLTKMMKIWVKEEIEIIGFKKQNFQQHLSNLKLGEMQRNFMGTSSFGKNEWTSILNF